MSNSRHAIKQGNWWVLHRSCRSARGARLVAARQLGNTGLLTVDRHQPTIRHIWPMLCVMYVLHVLHVTCYVTCYMCYTGLLTVDRHQPTIRHIWPMLCVSDCVQRFSRKLGQKFWEKMAIQISLIWGLRQCRGIAWYQMKWKKRVESSN